MAYAIFVFGPAGTGKSTFTKNLYEHGQLTNRQFTLINLDPPQKTDYPIDITEYITVQDVMEELNYGPNGGLVYALEEFYDNIDEIEELTSLGETDDYVIIDCPGQIELFTHSDVMSNIVGYFQKNFKCSIIYLIEAQYMMDVGKYLSGCLCAMLAMMRFNLPHVNVITKMDLVDRAKEGDIFDEEDEDDRHDMFYYPDERLREYLEKKDAYSVFGNKILDLLNDNNLVSWIPLNWSKDATIDDILYTIDNSIQYYEDVEPKETIKD